MENLPDGIAKYTWIPFYERLADRLLEYRDDRQSLIEKICAAFGGMGMELPKLDSTPVPVDIDPYTVYGLFNKGISESNRCIIAGALAQELGIDEELPQDFTGIPVVNNLNATFYAFANDNRRGEHDIENLWRVFEAEMALSAIDNEENRKTFIEAFNSTVVQFGLGWKLTMGL